MYQQIYYEKNIPHCKYIITERHDNGYVTVYRCKDNGEILYNVAMKMKEDRLAVAS